VLVSVLIPVYNVEAYVEMAVRSVLSQTYCKLEIVIVDDCSTDGTHAICQRLAAADARIRLFRNDSNRKIASTLNRAYAESTGEMIARMDGDDISEPDRIDRQVDYLNANPHIDLVGVNLIGIDASGNELNRFFHLWDQELLVKSSKYVTPVSHVWVARRSVYERLSGYRDIPGCEDYDFLLRMLSQGLRFGNIPDYFGYRVRIQRRGNTQAMIGLGQRKMFSYVYRLYLERRNGCADSFVSATKSAHLRVHPVSGLLYRISNRFLDRAIVARSQGQWLQCAAMLAGALISPHQIHYLYQRLQYRLMQGRQPTSVHGERGQR
jgi:glycosyltransferase involved in cell wall biosynthesis